MPAPLVPTMATTSPALRAERHLAQHRRAVAVRVAEADVAVLDLARKRGIGRQPAASRTSWWVSSTSKIRPPAASAACRVAFTRESRLIGVYIAKRAARNDVKAPVVRRPDRMAWLP